MSTQLTPQGLLVASLTQRIAQLSAKLQAIPGLGPDLNLDTSTIEGQMVAIFSESYNNLDQLAQKVWQSFNPNTATGAALSLLCLLNGITRQPGFYSIVPLSLTGTPGEKVPAGSKVQSTDGSNNIWVTENDVTFDSFGAAAVSAQCSELGAITAGIGVITRILTPVYGWDTVTNPSVAIQGALEETDAELRVRRAKSTTNPAQSIAESIESGISNLTGVQQCKVYENPNDTVDGDGLDPHSINVIVLGGTEADILKQIWLRKSLGVKLLGAISGTVEDSQGNLHTLKYDVPTTTRIYIIVNVHMLTDYPTTGDTDMIDALVAWFQNFKIGQEVVTSQLYTPINSVPGVSVSSLYIGTAPVPTSSANIATPFNSIATLASIDVTINHV